MKKQEQTILAAGLGLVGLWLFTKKPASSDTGNGGGVTTVPGLPQESGAAVGKIHKETPPGKTPCKDGTYSDFPANWRGGVCSYHGGAGAGGLGESENAVKY